MTRLTKALAQKLKDSQGTNVVIPSIYTSIEEEAFAIEWDDTSTGNKLTSVVIPDSITSIGDAAFSRNQLRSIEIPDSVISIGDSAFQKNLLKNVVIPSGVTFIDEESFEDNLLKSIRIGENVSSIGGEAFQGNRLKSIMIPDSVTYIDHDAFDFDLLETVSISQNASFDLSVFPKTVEIIRRDQSSIGNKISAPPQYKSKFAEKISNFNPSTDSLEIDTNSFEIKTSATFAAGKNKSKVKKLAEEDFNFLYDKQKGWLYFNENGSRKGFGDGGIIAILKGAPDLTSNNLEFLGTTTLSAPRKFNKKSADKITDFDPTKDTLKIDTDSFEIDQSASFKAAKNSKEVKKLAKKNFDFLYDQKKGGLYFNENGSAKSFGDGGIIAILKGAPEFTTSNMEFI